MLKLSNNMTLLSCILSTTTDLKIMRECKMEINLYVKKLGERRNTRRARKFVKSLWEVTNGHWIYCADHGLIK